MHLLWLFVSPLVASMFIFLFPKKSFAVLLSLIPLFLLPWVDSEVSYNWFPLIQFHLKIDSLSLIFLYLTAIVIPISMVVANRSAFFYSLILLLQALLIGFFTARDLVVFTVFWEAMLFPLYFIINGWGGENRQAAAYQFILYLIAGSSLLVAAILALYFTNGTFNIDELAKANHAPWIFAIFALAFAVKTPLFPFHGWLPDAYYEAPIAGSILLSALLSKAGIYGFLRIGKELFPTAMQEWSSLLLAFAIVGVFYAGFAAWRESDYKRLIAYSSLSHVNFILAGLFVWNQIAESGAVLQAFNHGITITALFLVAGWLAERVGTTSMGLLSGVANYLPHLCWLTLFFVLASVALPGLNNFVGEIMILWGIFIVHPLEATILTATVILSVIYMLRFMQKVYFETPSNLKHWSDIGAKEFAIALPLIALILLIGIYPESFLRYLNVTTH